MTYLCHRTALVTTLLLPLLLGGAYGMDTAAILDRKSEVQDAVHELRTESTVLTEYLIARYTYYSPDDPGVAVLSSSDGEVEFEVRRPGTPRVVRDGQPGYPTVKGTLVTNEQGGELIEHEAPPEHLRVVQRGDRFVLERTHQGRISLLLAHNGQERRLQHFSMRGSLVREESGDRVPGIETYAPFTPQGYAAAVQRAYSWDPEVHPGTVTVTSLENGIQFQHTTPGTGGTVRAEAIGESAIMVRDVILPRQGQALSTIHYLGQQPFMGLNFPTSRERFSLDEDGTMRDREELRSIQLSVVEPGVLDARLEELFGE